MARRNRPATSNACFATTEAPAHLHGLEHRHRGLLRAVQPLRQVTLGELHDEGDLRPSWAFGGGAHWWAAPDATAP